MAVLPDLYWRLQPYLSHGLRQRASGDIEPTGANVMGLGHSRAWIGVGADASDRAVHLLHPFSWGQWSDQPTQDGGRRRLSWSEGLVPMAGVRRCSKRSKARSRRGGATHPSPNRRPPCRAIGERTCAAGEPAVRRTRDNPTGLRQPVGGWMVTSSLAPDAPVARVRSDPYPGLQEMVS